jgi:hypothetical protein
VPTPLGIAGLCLALAGLGSACGDGGPPTSAEKGIATVGFTPLEANVSGLALESAGMHIRDILVIGNVPPPPPPRPPPPGPPPSGRPPPPPLPDIDLDVLSSGGSVTLSWLPQGLYSRVAFIFERVSLRGTWKGTPFSVSLANVMGQQVGLRASTPQELGPGQDVSFDVTVDPKLWFENGLLDAATPSGGQILLDDQNSGALVEALKARIVASFSLR